MKYILLVISTLFTMGAKSQTSIYHSFPEDTAAWVSDIYYNTCVGYCGTTFYEMAGDTSINGQLYNKIYNRGGQFYYIVQPPNPVIGANFSACTYVGAIRQDSINKKVYFIDSTMIGDTLLYDFNLAIGDTIESWYNKESMQWPLIVSNKDSVLVEGSFRNRYYFQNYPTHRNLVEGVGWSGELFGITEFALEVVLACFNGNDEVNPGWMAFQNECGVSLDCSIFSSSNELDDDHKSHLYPNPFTSELNIHVNSNDIMEIVIYDSTSRQLLNKKFNNHVHINTQQLPSGFYYYQLRNGYDILKTGTIVKN